MNAGDVLLIPIPQIRNGPRKLRPALLLAMLPGPFQNVLLCGISTQLHSIVNDWDELIPSSASDFASSGLHQDSVIRLSYLYAAEVGEIAGIIGQVSSDRLERILLRLCNHLRP